jgi:hypothetical protein
MPDLHAVLVTGSRKWTDAGAIEQVLRQYPVGQTVIIHGDCPTGADNLADSIARRLGYDTVRCPAPWERYRGAALLNVMDAGPDRNKAMLRVLRCLRWCEYKCSVEAFTAPSSRGTRHMIRIAVAEGFRVTEHDWRVSDG